ncbi:MAG: hypothetical protein EBS53_00075 [Bacteroidetes bacterium]|nr:hypothetical protein [Bacteroidota bacterium]
MAFSRTKTTLGLAFSDTVVTLSDEERARAVQGAQLTDLIQSLYSICLYDTNTDAILEAELDPGKRTKNAEYFFRVPPKVHEFDEPFATSISNTQDHGKYVESYGSIQKAIRISGTTGLRPNKIAPTTIPVLGVTETQLSAVLGNGLSPSIRTLSPDEKTGHDDIIFLRNIFRKYSDLKASDSLSGRVVMLWRNLKDADYWVVEPEDFKLSQGSNSPLTYEYSIAFKTLARFDFSYSLTPDPLEDARSRQRIASRVQEYGQNILNIFFTVSNQLNRLQGFSTFISNTILSPALGVINGLNAVKSTSFGVVRGLLNQVTTLSTNLQVAIAQLTEITEPADSVVRALRRLQIVCAQIQSEPIASESATPDVGLILNNYSAIYEIAGTITTARRAPDSSPTYIGYESTPAAVGADTVGEGEDIRDLATRLLGDRSRWRILVALNRLRSPFTAPVASPGVLAPGDTILFPADSAVARSSATVGTQKPTTNETNGNAQANTPVQLSYGRDLRLRSTFVGGTELTDLVINQRGDLSSIVGIPNVEQAVRIKFITERGELPAHPRFGAKFPIGTKATPSSFNELRINTINTLISDRRVNTVRQLSFNVVADTLTVSADVLLQNSQDIFSTSFALRRF